MFENHANVNVILNVIHYSVHAYNIYVYNLTTYHIFC